MIRTPYSDIPPQVIFPDTRDGRYEAGRYREQGAETYVCSEFIEDKSPIDNRYTTALKCVCRNRNPLGDRSHNWCMRCFAGFPVWWEADPDADSSWNDERMGFLTGSI